MRNLNRWSLAVGGAVVWLGAHGAGALAAEVLPKEPAPFKGKIHADRDKAVADWPQGVKAPPGAPNVVLVLLDDVGFGASSTFGGPAQTPELDKLADGGLRYNQFHVTGLCSPTRAALLSGRNHHQVGFGTVADIGSGYPGYNAVWKKNHASIATVLKGNGYSTAAFGKWHNTSPWEISPAGPFDRWPTGLGFEYFYGFLGGADNQWEPRLYRNTVAVEPRKTPAEGYHLTTDLADDAVKWLHQHDAVAPEKPFFLYFAPGATHSPHHVPKEWIAKYQGKFDQGWDKLREETFDRQKKAGIIPANAELTPRPKELPAWDSLSRDQKTVLARQAEVWAAFLAHTDQEVGRVVQAIKDEGKGDNTLVLYIVGDNGGEAAGGLDGQDLKAEDGSQVTDAQTRLKRLDDLGGEAFNNLYAGAWAWATNTPFQWSKQVASHLGGARDPLVVSWPARIKDKGGLRSQFHHVNDIAPTIYEAAGITFPEIVDGVKQAPLEGKSLAYSFDNAKAPSNHHVQYFEMVGNRGIYKDGWWAGARHLLPWRAMGSYNNAPIGQHPWELYNLNEDYSQAHDLAEKNPAKLKELVTLFDAEAKRNNVYPLVPQRTRLPSPADGKTVFTYREGAERIPLKVSPDLTLGSHTITADIQTPATGADGVIVAEGGRFGGFSLYVKDGRLVYDNNAFNTSHSRIVASEPLPVGKIQVAFEFIADPKPVKLDPYPGRSVISGTGRLLVNGSPVGEGRFPYFGGFTYESLDVGSDLGSPVATDYASPSRFTGTVEKVTIELTKKKLTQN